MSIALLSHYINGGPRFMVTSGFYCLLLPY